jgi:type I restriction enzyme, S subunit
MGGRVVFVTWLSTSEMGERLNANFYEPEYLKIEAAVKACPYGAISLGNCLKRVFKGAFYVLAEEYESDGIPFLRVADITKGYVDRSKCAYLPISVHLRERKTAVRAGFLLIAKSGSIGNCAVVPLDISEANISQDLIGAVPKSELDSYFAVAFLSTRFGVNQMFRWMQGNVHPHLSNDAVRSIHMPEVPLQLQTAIGNKLRKAERLRELASNEQRYRSVEIKHAFGGTQLRMQSSFGWIPSQKFENGRIDAWFHQPAYVAFADALKDRKDLLTVGQIASIISDTASLHTFASEYFDYYEIADVDSDSGMIVSDRVAVDDAPSRAKYLVQTGDILVSTVRPNRKGIAIVPDGVARAVCSSGFAVLRADDIAIAYYIRGCLLNDIATHQLMRWNTGATYPAIERWVPLEVRIPDVGTERMKEIGSALHESSRAMAIASGLVQTAKADVEALIDGTLNESDLLAESEEIERWLKENPVHMPTKGALNVSHH